MNMRRINVMLPILAGLIIAAGCEDLTESSNKKSSARPSGATNVASSPNQTGESGSVSQSANSQAGGSTSKNDGGDSRAATTSSASSGGTNNVSGSGSSTNASVGRSAKLIGSWKVLPDTNGYYTHHFNADGSYEVSFTQRINNGQSTLPPIYVQDRADGYTWASTDSRIIISVGGISADSGWAYSINGNTMSLKQPGVGYTIQLQKI